LKIEGDVMASQKLDFIDKVDESLVKEAMGMRGADDPAAAPKVAPGREAVAPKVFDALRGRLTDPGVVLNGLNVPVLFRITDPDGVWLVDLERRSVTAGQGEAAAVLTLSDATLAELAKNPGAAAALYQRGKLRVDGDLSV